MIYITLQEIPGQRTRHHLELVDGIPPPNRRAIRMKKPMGGAIPPASGKQSGRMEHGTPTRHPRSQQLPKRHYQDVPQSAAHWPRTTSDPKPSRRGKQPPSGRKGAPTKGTAYTGHTSAQLSGQQSHANGVSMEEGLEGMVGREKLIAAVWVNQISPKKTQPLSN